MKKIPSIQVPIIDNGSSAIKNLFDTLINKKVIIFGVPGAFTPKCSEQHLPGFLELSDKFRDKGIDEIYCLSVNDQFVMQSWLLSYPEGSKIKGIADGNADITRSLNLLTNKSSNFMGTRCKRFAMIIKDNIIQNIFIEEAGKLDLTSGQSILSRL